MDARESRSAGIVALIAGAVSVFLIVFSLMWMDEASAYMDDIAVISSGSGFNDVAIDGSGSRIMGTWGNAYSYSTDFGSGWTDSDFTSIKSSSISTESYHFGRASGGYIIYPVIDTYPSFVYYAHSKAVFSVPGKIYSDGNRNGSPNYQYALWKGTINGGSVYNTPTWTEIPNSNVDYPQFFAVARDDENIIAYVLDTGGGQQVKVTVNGGTAWNSYGYSAYYKDLAMSASGTYMAGASGTGLYVSSDTGSNWSLALSGDFRAADVSEDGRFQVAVEYGGGVWWSEDYGATWTEKGTTQNWIDVEMDDTGAKTVMTDGTYIYGNQQTISGPESCSDGIQNQDETAIDYGGVCGIPALETTEGGLSCSTYVVPNLSDVTWNDFGTLPNYLSGSQLEEKAGSGAWGYIDRTDNLNRDVMIVRGYDQDLSEFPHGSMEYPGTGTGSFYFRSSDDYLSIASKRDGIPYAPDVIQFYNAQNFPLGYFAEYTASFQDGQLGSSIDYASGGISTAYALYGQVFDGFLAKIYGSWNGFRMGRSNSLTTLKQCSTSVNFCEWQSEGNSYQCRGSGGGTFVTGQCGVNGSGACVPLVDPNGEPLPPLPLPGQIDVVDGSGNVVGSYVDGTFVKGKQLRLDNIFECPNYEDIFDSFDCLKTIVKNVYTALFETNNAIQDGETVKTLKSVGSGSQSGDMSDITYTGSSITYKLIAGGWNKSMDEDDTFAKYGRMLFISSIVFIILIAVLMIAAVIRKD